MSHTGVIIRNNRIRAGATGNQRGIDVRDTLIDGDILNNSLYGYIDICISALALQTTNVLNNALQGVNAGIGIKITNFQSGAMNANDIYNFSVLRNVTGTIQPGADEKNDDPLFTDPSNGDFTPQEESPCLDAAVRTGFSEVPTIDALGNPRPIDQLLITNTDDGTDIGAIELSFYFNSAGFITGVPESKVENERHLFLFLSKNIQGEQSLLNTNAVEDYSSVSQEFFIKPPINEIWEISRMLVMIQAATAIAPDKYGDLDALTNGIKKRVLRDSVELLNLTPLPIKDNTSWGQYCFNVEEHRYGIGGANDFVLVRWSYFKSGANIFLNGKLFEKLTILLSDDFTGLVKHTFHVQGIRHRLE
jgi:hypothetical protein